MDSLLERREIHFGGMVQGVGFRYTARRIAQRFPVTGFVENLRDGRVRVVVQGAAGEIERFLLAIESEFEDYIHTKEQHRLEPTDELRSFEIRF
jgi:acylphosphatase